MPPVTLTLDGAVVGQTIKLPSESGVLVLGAGADPDVDPFKVTIQFTVNQGTITYALNTEPWAIVHGRGGLGLGKTPLAATPGDPTTLFELANPKENRQLRITLHYAGP